MPDGRRGLSNLSLEKDGSQSLNSKSGDNISLKPKVRKRYTFEGLTREEEACTDQVGGEEG